MKATDKYIRCSDGSFLRVDVITRLFAQQDGITQKGVIRASTPGFAQPFAVSVHDNLADAQFALIGLIERLEEKLT